MAFDITAFKKSALDKVEWLTKELQGVRTGRATPALLDSVKVEVYGSMTPINQTGSVSVEDARSLYISPWDKSQIKAIEKAVMLADLGVSVGSDSNGVRVSFPELTAERRTQLIKIVHAKHEEARVGLKGVRTKGINDAEDGVNDDEAKRLKNEIQKIVDEVHGKFEELVKKKEVELQS